MKHIQIKSRSKTKTLDTSKTRKSSHDFSNYLLSMNQGNKICVPLKPKEGIKSKFFKANKLKISLPKLEDIKMTMPTKFNSSSKLLLFNQNVNVLSQKNNSKQNLPSINLPKLSHNNSQIYEKRRKSVSYIKTPMKKMYLEHKIINDYYASTLAGVDDYGEEKINQDSYLILTKINNLTNYNVFAVFDGHGPDGHLVSQFLVKYFTDFFQTNSQILKCKSEPEVYNVLINADYKILRDAVKNCENQLFEEEDDINAHNSGSTLCMIIQVYKKIICMNIGDSRAIVYISELLRDEIKNLSIDHKPELKKEQERIKKNGGYVERCVYEDGKEDGPYRVWSSPSLQSPGLAISRSIGDFDATKLGVIAEPDFYLKALKKEINFIVIASDGIWEFMDNKKVCDIVKNFIQNGTAKEAADELVKKSREIWDERGKEVDDITAIIIFL